MSVKFAARRQVKQRRCRREVFCLRQKVKQSVSRPNRPQALHLRSKLHCPKGNFTFRGAKHFVEKSTCECKCFFLGGPSRARPPAGGAVARESAPPEHFLTRALRALRPAQKKKTPFGVFSSGGPSRARTLDRPVMSRLL